MATRKAIEAQNQTRLGRCLKVLVDNIPLGSIQLPLFDSDGDRKYNSVTSRICGVFFSIVFMAYIAVDLATFGSISTVLTENAPYKTNHELSKKNSNIKLPDSLWNSIENRPRMSIDVNDGLNE